LLSLALKSRELMKNLIMLLFTARTVIVHSANNELKMNLVRVVKKNLSFKPVVMAVGQGDKCFKMLNEASIGVKIDNKLSNWFFSDIKIEKFSQLEQVILDLGFNGYKGIKMIYLLFMFKQGMIGTLLFLFQSQCGYSACSMISFDLVVVYELLISFSFVLFSGLATRSKVFNEFEIRMENMFLDRRVANMIVSFVVGVVQGTLIMVFVVFASYGIGDNGMNEDLDSVGLTAFILVNLVLFAHGFVILKSFRKLLWVTLYCFVLMVIVLAVACNSNISINYLSNSSFSKKPTTWFLILVYPFVGVIISFTFISFISILIPMTPPRLIQYKQLEKVFCDSFNSFQAKDKNEFALDNITLKFKDVYQEAEFLNHMHHNSIFYLKLIFVISLVLEVINNIFIAYGLIGFLDLKIYTIIITCFSFVLVLVGFYVLNEKRLILIEMMSLAGLLVFSIVETYVNTTVSTIPRYAIFAALYSIIISTGFFWTIVKYIIIYFASIAVVVYETYVINYNGIAVHTSHWSIIMMFLLILLGLANYQQEKNKRKQYTFIKQAEIEVDKSSTILGYLLPEFVRKRVKDGARYISEDKGTVSILFCDIYDFDTIMNLYSPQELTYLMNDLFGRIDLICENFGVAKIETVGKTYLACAGLKDSEVNIDPIISKISHARRAVELGLTILKESEKIVLKNGQKIKFKIGVNSGPVTAGVVGFHKPQFSLVGDTVNTASRMASTLKQADAVQISLNTFELLGSTHGLKFSDYEIDVKGKGNMDTKVVSFIEQTSSDNNGEELTSIQGNLASPVKSSFSSPTLHSINHRQSDNLTIKNQNRLSSILEKLGIKNTEELVRKQTNRSVQGIFNILCKETEEEKKLRLNYIEEISKTQKIGLFTSVTCDSLLILAEIIYYLLDLEHSSLPRLLIIGFGEVAMIFLIYLKPKCDNKISFALALSSLYTLEFIGIFICEFFAERSSIIQYMYFVYKFTLLNFFSGTFFGKNLYFNFILISMWIADTLYRYPSLPSVTYTVSYILIILFSAFSDEQRLRMNTILKLAAEKEINQTQQLLTHMMPPNALANFEEGTQVMDRLTQVTVMYADIVGFTAWSSIRSPREVVGMLSELFTRFDKQCIENNVYKVHTIGDCYVAMGYINDKNRNPAKEAVNMLYFAHSLIGIISETNEKCGIKLGMRIGIHTGEITGGITGTKIVRYDIYGPHVMIANKMESSGKEGNVAVSESTKELIDNYKPNLFSFTKAKEVYLDSLSQSINLYFADLTEAAPNN
jgi:class 3 adenylate cyclase